MSNQRLINENAVRMAWQCTALLVNVLDEEQQRQATEGFYEICKAGLEYYSIHDERMQQRLRPSKN